MDGQHQTSENQNAHFVNKLTDITVLLDRSGSMTKVRQETIDGVNEFISGQRAAVGRAVMTHVQFDSRNAHEPIGVPATPVELVPALTPETYQPRGGTPLWDALGTCINRTDARHQADAMTDMQRDVVFVIITDGYENASRQFTREQVITMIRHRESVLGWKFIYLGADIDTFGRGYMGTRQGRSVNIDKAKMHQAMTRVSDKLAAYRRTGDQQQLDWTGKERSDIG